MSNLIYNMDVVKCTCGKETWVFFKSKEEYDSLSDMVSFGAAPALVMYLWAFSSMGKLGLFAAFVHMAGGALRLARFNTQLTSADKRYFQGLPSPAAAAILAGFIWLSLDQGYSVEIVKYIALALTISTGLLMVSNFRYSSFKEIDLKLGDVIKYKF